MRRRGALVYRVFWSLFLFFLAQSAFAQSLYEMPQGIEARVASGENPTGEKGKGGQANGGRKGAATVPIKAGASRILAEAKNTSGTESLNARTIGQAAFIFIWTNRRITYR